MIIKHFTIQIIDKIKIIKYLKVLQHVSDHRGSIISGPCIFLAKNYKTDSIVYCTRLPDDGSSVIRNMLKHF